MAWAYHALSHCECAKSLFLGPGFCKAVRVPTAGTRGELQSNCIYYSHPNDDDHSKCLAALDLGSCTVYCYESRGVDHSESERIMTRGYHYSEKADRVNNRNQGRRQELSLRRAKHGNHPLRGGQPWQFSVKIASKPSLSIQISLF
jgi:hypothetical protein